MGDKQPHQALYRRYRSRSFDDVVGQNHVTSTLKSAVKSKRVVHAYLFTGPHGVGKTSVARILAYAVNDLSYDADSQHLDIIEIDAASNRGIDEVRELREKAMLTPSSARYKVYIIDEVHMLTPPAFNALLKLLEEPPAHTIFILATTEAHKVPATIRSRSQWYAFRPIEIDAITKHLSEIAGKENIKADKTALKRIAEHGRGSLRDSIGLLDQLSSDGGHINEDRVVRLLGLVPQRQIEELLAAAGTGDWQAIRQTLSDSLAAGYGAKQLAKQLIERLQAQDPSTDNLKLIQDLLGVAISPEPALTLQISLLKPAVSASSPEPVVPATLPTAPAPLKPQSAPHNFTQQHWPEILAEIKKQNNSLYAILRLAQPALEHDSLRLTFGFVFHKQRLDEDHNRQTVADIASLRLGRPISVTSHVGAVPVEPAASNELDAVVQVMGGGELSAYEETP